VVEIIHLIFDPHHINKEALRERAHNMRWAELGKDIIPLTSADLDFPCAPQIIEAIKSYSNVGYFNYGPAEGLPILKESLSDYMRHYRDVKIEAKNILPVNSAAFGIYNVCKALLNPGDEAIIFDPVDFLFRYAIENVGGVAIPFSIPDGSNDIDFSTLEKLITNRTKLICLCNPLNPTGKVFTKKELFSLASVANKHGLIILSDEIWSDVVYSPNVFTSIASLDDEINNKTVIVTGFSKSYGLAGLRVGAVMTSNNILYQKILGASLHNSTINGVSTISQIAAATAINDCQGWLSQFLQHLSNMRTLCTEAINNIDGFSCIAPEGCYVSFVDIKQTGMSSEELYFYLLQEAKVAVVPGLKKWFGEGAEGYIRISFATSEDILMQAFSNINSAMNKISKIQLV
jgi:aspartate/methionine/tyrosine aminotransferase